MISFTIITCTYHAEHVLQRTLDSVSEQTYPYVEHLIIDGASKDRTAELAASYKQKSDAQKNGHEVIIVSEPDHGLYDAMNKGLTKARGVYLVFLNAGDVFPADSTLEHIAGSVGDGEPLPAVLYGDTDIVNDAGRFLRHRRLSPPKHLSWRSFSSGMLVCHQAFYARTDLARTIPYNLSYRYSADFDWCIHILKAAEAGKLPLKNVNETVVNYLDGGMTVKNHRASLKERFLVMKHHYGLFLTLLMHALFVVRAIFRP